MTEWVDAVIASINANRPAQLGSLLDEAPELGVKHMRDLVDHACRQGAVACLSLLLRAFGDVVWSGPGEQILHNVCFGSLEHKAELVACILDAAPQMAWAALRPALIEDCPAVARLVLDHKSGAKLFTNTLKYALINQQVALISNLLGADDAHDVHGAVTTLVRGDPRRARIILDLAVAHNFGGAARAATECLGDGAAWAAALQEAMAAGRRATVNALAQARVVPPPERIVDLLYAAVEGGHRSVIERLPPPADLVRTLVERAVDYGAGGLVDALLAHAPNEELAQAADARVHGGESVRVGWGDHYERGRRRFWAA